MIEIAKFEAFLQSTFGFRGFVCLGGSVALREAGQESDIDWYVIGRDVCDVYHLLRHTHAIGAYIRAIYPNSQVILCTEWLLRHRWYYAYGIDAKNRVHSWPIDPQLLRNNALKVAYQEFVQASLSEIHRGYHLAKALLYGIYSMGLGKRLPIFLTQPLFSHRHLQDILPTIDLVADTDICKKILAFKFASESVPETSDMAYVGEVLEQAYTLFAKDPWSWRSYLLYNIFAFKHGDISNFFHNPDRLIVEAWRKATIRPTQAEFTRLRRHTAPLLII